MEFIFQEKENSKAYDIGIRTTKEFSETPGLSVEVDQITGYLFMRDGYGLSDPTLDFFALVSAKIFDSPEFQELFSVAVGKLRPPGVGGSLSVWRIENMSSCDLFRSFDD